MLFKHLYIKCVDNILSYFEVNVSFFCCVCVALRSGNFKQQSELYSNFAQGCQVGPKFPGVLVYVVFSSALRRVYGSAVHPMF